MTAILALVLKFLPYLVQAATSIPQLTEFLAQLKLIFKRDKIWTPEQAAQFDAETVALRNDPAFQIID